MIRSFYFQCDEDGQPYGKQGTGLYFVCVETTPGKYLPGSAGAIGHFVQYLYNLAH